MKIDVVIPVKDVDTWLAEAIHSVLNQESVTVSVTVVDAGSSEPIRLSRVFEHDNRVQLLRNESPLFVGAARDLGLKSGDAPLLGFLDADDLWPTDRCRRLAQVLEETKADIVVGRAEEFGERHGLMSGAAHFAGGVLIRRQAYEALGGHDPTLGTGEWVDLMGRARHRGLREVEVDVLSLQRRIHGASTTVARRDLRSEYLRVVRAQLTRHERDDD